MIIAAIFPVGSADEVVAANSPWSAISKGNNTPLITAAVSNAKNRPDFGVKLLSIIVHSSYIFSIDNRKNEFFLLDALK